MSPRDALAPLGVAFHFDAVESEGAIKFVARGRPAGHRRSRIRSRAARRRSRLRLLAHPRAGNRSAAGRAHRLYRRRRRLSPGDRGIAAAGGRQRAHRAIHAAAGARPGPGHRHRGARSDGGLGRARDGGLRAAAVLAGARSGRRGGARGRRAHAPPAPDRNRRCRRAPHQGGRHRSLASTRRWSARRARPA